jgi:threonine dehydrogenase-like Zn-dependent dehydrogenase
MFQEWVRFMSTVLVSARLITHKANLHSTLSHYSSSGTRVAFCSMILPSNLSQGDRGDVNAYDRMMEMTGGRGPDRCIDAVLDQAKAALFLATDRPHVLREAIRGCRKGGTISIPGVYVGFLDRIPFGAAMNKGLTLTMGQTHVPRYHAKLLHTIEAGAIDPSFVITHQLTLDEDPHAYKTFRDKQDGCMKVALKP